MNHQIKISVITVVYNGIDLLRGTMESVFAQTYPNIEYIIIDGNSNDGTLELIKENESKITKWISEPDKGLYDAMNKGIKLATGDFLWFMNAGDRIFAKDTLMLRHARIHEDYPERYKNAVQKLTKMVLAAAQN